MTKAQKRVALAKEVLSLFKAGKLRESYGSYVEPKTEYLLDHRAVFADHESTLPNGRQLDETKFCAVCAAGALAVAYRGVPNYVMLSKDVTECLKPVFSLTQLGLIETAYEGTYSGPLGKKVKPGKKLAAAASKYVTKAAREDGKDSGSKPRLERLKAIMRNIIRNKGQFVP